MFASFSVTPVSGSAKIYKTDKTKILDKTACSKCLCKNFTVKFCKRKSLNQLSKVLIKYFSIKSLNASFKDIF